MKNQNESRVMAGLLLSNLLSLLLGAGIGICIYRRCVYNFFGIQIKHFVLLISLYFSDIQFINLFFVRARTSDLDI